MILKYAPIMFMLALWGCNSHSAEQQAPAGIPDVELVTYQVPEGSQEMIKEVLNRSFRSLSTNPIARVEILPGGQIAVLAPAKVHKGVAVMVKDLSSMPMVKPRNSHLSVWMVLAKPDDATRFGNGLAAIKGVLEEVAMSEKYNYMLLDRMGVTAATGTQTRGFGRYFETSFSLSQASGQTVVELYIEGQRGVESNLRTQLYLEKDKYTVLGESSFMLHERVAKETGMEKGPYVLFYILKANDI